LLLLLLSVFLLNRRNQSGLVENDDDLVFERVAVRSGDRGGLDLCRKQRSGLRLLLVKNEE
jgi:hypothetical protein